jgi:ferricrocin synthase
MEEDQTFQFTQFPNLNATHQPSEARACLRTHWQGRFSSLPDEVLILAWASLLQAFTRVSTPVFSLNTQPISVDISRKRWTRLQIHQLLEGAEYPSHLILLSETGHAIHDVPSKELSRDFARTSTTIPTSLSFQYDSKTGYGLLSSSGNVPESFLGDLERQLLQMVCPALTQERENGPPPSTAPSLSVLNAQRKYLKGPLFLHELLSRHWTKSSTAIDFLNSDGQRIQISYTTLNYLTNNLACRIASQLSSEGALPSHAIIPVYIPQCPELYCALIAILKANAAFCPIGLDMPHERMKYILEDVGAEIVLTLPEFTSRIAEVRPDIQVIEVQAVQRMNGSVNSYDRSLTLPKLASPDDLAYVMYTSGSTGVPKGVSISHAAVTQALLAHDEYVPQFARFLQFAAPTFDVSVFETFFPLFRGATLVTRDREHMLSDLPGTLTGLSIDAAELTPTVAGTLLRNREAAPCLRLLLTIGEMLTRPVIEEFAEGTGRHGILLPMYGPTEASIHCTLATSVTAKTKAGVIGRPLSTVTSLIIREVEEAGDVSIEVLPVGQVGELVIAGQLATGYLNRPEQNEVSFRFHPVYGRIYRTGDRARLLPCGDLEYLGRISSGQIKIRGQRVELGEIEQVVCKAKGIQSATASIIDDILVVFCVAFSKDASREQIMDICKLWLPSFMRPGDVVLLVDEVPRLASGKINKGRLEVDYRMQMEATKDSPDCFHSQLEHHIMRCIKAEMSKTVSPTDDLWSSGLDSLRAIKLASRLREEGLWLSVKDILEAENVTALAKRLGIAQSTGTLPSRPQIEMPGVWDPETVRAAVLESLSSDTETSKIETFRPCSPLQIAMLVESSRKGSLNFNSIKVRLPDRVSVPVFCEAFQVLAHHNKILRSGFVRTDTQQYPFCQIIWKQLDIKKSDHAAVSLCQLNGSGVADHALLYPVSLQFVDTKEDRVCTIHLHHALYDGWSFELILRDLERIISGQRILHRPQFDDVLKYQLRRRLGPVSDAAHRYWQNHLQEIRLASFPKLLTKQILKSGRQSCTRAFTLDLDDLNSTCRRLHASRQSVVSAAFAILLSSYVGNSDVVFGAVASGRTMPIQGIERIIGPCISTFPMRLDVSRLRTIRDVINSTHRQHHDFLQFDDITLAEIKALSGIAGGNPLFDCLFVWQEGPEALQGSERILTIVDTSDSLDYAVVLEIEPRDDKLQAKISFETSKLSANHAMLFLSQLNSLLTLSTRVPEAPVRNCYTDMSMEGLSIENADFCTFDHRFTLTSTIDALANEDPSRTAIEFVDVFDPQCGHLKTTLISYGELYRRSGRVSQSLATKGASPDSVISIVIEKSVELYVAILGVIRSGAAYLAIDPRTPPDRLRKILEDSRCRIVITEDLSRASVGPAGPCEYYSMSELEHGFGDVFPAIRPPLDRQGENLAYVVYTSGSTGVPKGVLITRSNVLSNIDCLSRLYPSNSASKLLQACSQAFDVSVFEIFFTWHMGMSLCVANNDILFRDTEFLIRRMNISHLSLTPSVAALIDPENVPNVKFLVTAGEPMNSKVFNSWIDRGLYQGYGPSETTNICNVRPKVTLGDFPNNVGPPLPNSSIFICQGEDFIIMPRGAVGEIWIGGDQVGRGYLYNDELTRKSFINHTTYGKLYRSGDIGRLLADGSLVILGREDDQVKLRGQRVELGDINEALISSIVVKDAITLVVDAASNEDARLVSFWTPDPPMLGGMNEIETQTQAILTELEARLPGYMIPDVLIPLNHMPLTGQGKIDRKTLVEQFEGYDQSLLQRFSRANEQQGDSRVLSQHEALIAQSIADVIGIAPPTIHPHTSFFAIGLDSIKSISVSQRLRKLGFGQVDVSKILHHASVRRLASYLSSSTSSVQDASGALEQPTTERLLDDEWQKHVKSQFADVGYSVARIIPSTPLQESMLSSYDIHSGDSYRNQLVFRVSGDLAELELSWKAMLSRHQLLRTGFALTTSSASAFAQVVLENFTLPWSWGNTQPDDELGNQLQDGYMLPPYSLKATQDGNEGSSTLTLSMHHALYDGEAMNLLLREVETHYLGGRLPPLVPFDRYLEYMLSLDLTSTDKFWRSQLDGYQSQLVTEIFRPAIQEHGPAHFTTSLVSRVSLSTIEAELKRMSTTLLAILQTSWGRLLSRYLRTFDVCFGNVYSGRSIPVRDAGQIIGPCFNTLPVRVELKRLQTTAELSRRLQETNTVILPYQPSSLRRIQKNHVIERPLFDTLLLLQAAEHSLNSDIWTLVEETGDMNFPVICEIIPDTINDQLRLRLHIQGGRFPAPEARRLLENFDLLLRNDLQYNQASSRDCAVLEGNLPSVPLGPQIKAISPSAWEHGRPEHIAEEAFSSLEKKIRQILSEACETDITQTKKLASIFQLGLDSIATVQIAAKLRREGFNVTGGEILEASTIEGITQLCSRNSSPPKKTSPSFDLVAFDDRYRSQVCQQICVPPCTVEAILPCTSAQSGILAEFVHSEGQFYFNCLTLRLTGITDVNRLKEAWVHVISRHEILRMGFVEIENADHPFAMITYRPSIHQLPWNETSELGDVPAGNIDGKRILESLHQPPWCLSYSKQGGNCLLKLSILHALYDAQSLDLILADVATLYHGNELPPATRVHAALSSILSRSRIQHQESESFFTKLGKSFQPARFPDLRIYNYELHGVSLVAQLCRKSQHELRQGCQKAGMSLQTAIQCAWAQLLAAYTGGPEVTFGVIFSGRTSEEREDPVAFPTMNTLPMSLHVSENVADLVRQASKLNAALMQRQFVPLTQIMKWFDAKGSLFDTVVVLQQYHSSREGIALWEVVSDEAQTEHALSLEIVPDDVEDRVTLRLTFRRNILPLEQANIVLSQFEALLYTIIFPPQAERNTLISRRYDLFSIIPAKHSRITTSMRFLHEMVEQSAQIWPEKIALEFATSISNGQASKHCWTYKSLNQEANKIAHLLVQQGALPGDMIGVCFDKCPEASFAILGILKAGCAFLAVDTNAPEARKDFILRDSTCKFLLCKKDKLEDFEQIEDLRVLALDDETYVSSMSPEGPQLSRELKPDDTCYCLYTSGTTGQPKGCLITHDNAVQALLSFQRIFAGQWDENSRWLQFASFHFDVSVLEQFWSWSVGICVTSAPRDMLFEDLPGTITALQITHLDLTPSLARLLKPEEVPSLCRGVFITGGEQLRQDVLDVWGDVGVLYNFYGPSEVTIGCTVHQRVPKSAKPSNIGQQFDNVGTFVLDLQTTQPVLRGAIGELCLSGPLVGKGYLNRTELTETKFEYLPRFRVRIYHTGDLVRLLHDGSFEFLGRSDDQVKLRGQRLEIEEINHVLTWSDSSLQDVATMVVKHPKQANEHLVSFLSWSERSTRTANPILLNDDKIQAQVATIRQISEGKLPGYMVPTYLIPVSVMPLSANNKVELNTLKSLFANTTAEDLQRLSTITHSAVRLEESSINEIIGILSKRLGLAETDISPTSSLFELGMDSISVIGLARSLKDAGFSAAQPALVMRHSTVAGLAMALLAPLPPTQSHAQLQKDASNKIASFAEKHRDYIVQRLGIHDANIEKIAPCTPLQEGMISKTLHSNRPVYAPTFTYDLSDKVVLHRLQDAWLSVQPQNEILRTRFVATKNGFAQVVLHNPEAQKCFLQSHHEGEDTSEAFERDLEYWYDSVKTLESMPWRVILKEERGRKVMIVHMFHGLFDGISLPLLLENVARNYLGQDLGMANPSFHDILPFGPLRVAAGAKAFWQKSLNSNSLGVLDLPQRHIENAERGSSVKTINLEHLAAFDLLRSKLKVTMPALFHACWLLVLHKQFSTVPTLGVVVSGRGIDIEGAQNVIGPMFNTLPCLIKFGAGLSASDLVEACHKFNVDSLPFQHTALRDISKWIAHDLSQPLFDSLFVFQKEAEGLLASSELWTARESTSEPDFPLSVEVQQNLNDSFAVTVAANPQYLDTEDVQTLLKSFEDTLYNMLENPDQPLPIHRATPHIRNSGTNAPANAPSSAKHFVWTPETKLIRREVGALTNANIEAIQANSTIFELGLDSIDAIKLSARLRSIGISLSVGDIIRTGTIENMAKLCVQKAATGPKESPRLIFDNALTELRQSLRRQGVLVDKYEKVLPATPLQEGMLANFEQYCGHDLLELESGVDVRQLRTAWENVVHVTPILRTSFIEIKDPKSATAYAQLVHRVHGMDGISQFVNWHELTVGAESKLDGALTEQQLRMVERGLEHPMLDLSLVTMKTRKFLVLGMAHAIYDGWSINLLHQDVERSYSGNTVERPPYEPALGHILDDQNGASQRFWKKKLGGVSPSLFPRHAKKHITAAFTIRDQIRSKYTAEKVQEFCKAQGVTAQALGLTCYSIVLAGFLKKLEICFGLVLSGRTTDNYEEVMFPTMNTVIFSTRVEGSRRHMLKAVHDRIIEMSEHQFFPLRKAKALSGVEGALFDALFIYQKRPQIDGHYHQLYHSIRTSSDVEYPVNVEMEFHGTDVLWRAACKDTVLKTVMVAQMLADLDRVLDEVMRSPNEPVIQPLATNMVKICGICTIEYPQEPRGTIPKPNQPSEKLTADTMTEWSCLEKAIREVLASVSGFPQEHILKKTSLFSLGLDSINSVKVSSMLREKSISLPVSVMLNALTIEKMAAAATRLPLVKPNSRRPDPAVRSPLIGASHYQEAFEYLKSAGIMPEDVESIMPATAGQHYVLGVWRASGGRLFYSDFFYKSISLGLNADKFEQAWSETVRQLPILRTTFIASGGCQILQVQMKHDRTFSERSDRFLAPPTKLLTETSASGVRIKLSIHHALYDAVSLPVIISTLEKCCYVHGEAVDSNLRMDRRQQTASSLHTDPFHLEKSLHSLDRPNVKNAVRDASTVAPSSSALNAFIASTRSAAARQSARAFWTNYLADHERGLPMEQPLTSFESARVEHYRSRLLGNVVEAEKIGRDRSLSFHSLFLATFAIVHAKLISRSSIGPGSPKTITIGVYLANRSLDIEGLVELAHPTFNVVPLRIKVPSDATIFDVAENIQGDLGKVGHVQNCGVSLYEIYEWTGIRIDCCVNFLKLPPAEKNRQARQLPGFQPVARSSSGEDARVLPPPPPPPPFIGGTQISTSEAYLPSIDIEASVREGGLDVGVFAPVDLLNDQTAIRVLEELQSLLSTSSLMK